MLVVSAGNVQFKKCCESRPLTRRLHKFFRSGCEAAYQSLLNECHYRRFWQVLRTHSLCKLRSLGTCCWGGGSARGSFHGATPCCTRPTRRTCGATSRWGSRSSSGPAVSPGIAGGSCWGGAFAVRKDEAEDRVISALMGTNACVDAARLPRPAFGFMPALRACTTRPGRVLKTTKRDGRRDFHQFRLPRPGIAVWRILRCWAPSTSSSP